MNVFLNDAPIRTWNNHWEEVVRAVLGGTNWICPARGLEDHHRSVTYRQMDGLGDSIRLPPSPTSVLYSSMDRIMPTENECNSDFGLRKWKTRNFTAKESKVHVYKIEEFKGTSSSFTDASPTPVKLRYILWIRRCEWGETAEIFQTFQLSPQ